MKRISELIQNTPLDVRRRANRCIARLAVKPMDRGSKAVASYVSSCPVTGSALDHTCTIHWYSVGAHSTDAQVWLTCSCAYFLYYLEVALARYGNTSIINSDGSAPVEKNPRQVPYLCKHLFAASQITFTAEDLQTRKRPKRRKASSRF